MLLPYSSKQLTCAVVVAVIVLKNKESVMFPKYHPRFCRKDSCTVPKKGQQKYCVIKKKKIKFKFILFIKSNVYLKRAITVIPMHSEK